MPAARSTDQAERTQREHSADLPLAVEDAVELIGELAEQWGGELERRGGGGRLALPVAAGLRHGLAEGELSVSRLGADGSRVELRVESERYRLHVSAVVVLLIGAGGGLFLMVAPLVLGARSIGLLPAAFFVMLAAWFLVASRVRHRGVTEFLQSLAEAGKAASTEDR